MEGDWTNIMSVGIKESQLDFFTEEGGRRCFRFTLDWHWLKSLLNTAVHGVTAPWRMSHTNKSDWSA